MVELDRKWEKRTTAKKQKILCCYDVQIYDEKLTSNVNIFQEVKKLLEKRETVEKRYRQLAEVDESGEGEFIANYKIINNEMITACFIAMKKGVAAEIKKAFFTKESFALSDIEIEDKKDVEGHIKDHTHFLLTKDFLILKSSRAIKSETISTYLNWLLLSEKKYAGRAAVFRLQVHLRKTVDINDIAAFVIGDNFKIGKDNLIKKTLSASKDVIQDALSASNLKVDPTKVLDAYITFRIKKVSKEDEEAKEEVIQTLLKTFTEGSYNILNKQGRPIDLENIKAAKDIRITHTDSGFPDEAELEKEMILYLQEIMHEKSINKN